MRPNRGALGILELALAIALLAKIPTIEQLVPDLVQRQTAAGGMFRPRHISAMKIAGIRRIIVKLFERFDLHMVCATLASGRLLALHRFALALLILRDTGKKVSGFRIDTALC